MRIAFLLISQPLFSFLEIEHFDVKIWRPKKHIQERTKCRDVNLIASLHEFQAYNLREDRDVDLLPSLYLDTNFLPLLAFIHAITSSCDLQ